MRRPPPRLKLPRHGAAREEVARARTCRRSHLSPSLLLPLVVPCLLFSSLATRVASQSTSADCIFVTGSQQCPDYNNRVRVNLTLNTDLNHFSQVSEFDSFVNRTIDYLSSGLLSKNAGSDLGCPVWDEQYLQYVRGFICEVIYTSDQVVGNCTAKASIPTLCAPQCRAMYDSTFNLINNNCPANSSAAVVSARTNTLESILSICAATSTTCFPGLSNEQVNCGFTTYGSAYQFCSQTTGTSAACCSNLAAPSPVPTETPKEKQPGCFPAISIFSCEIVYGVAAGLCFAVLSVVAFVLVVQEQKRNRSMLRAGAMSASAARAQYKMPPGGGGVVPGRRGSAGQRGSEAYYEGPPPGFAYPPNSGASATTSAPRIVSLVASPVPSQNVSMVFLTSQSPATGTLGAPMTYAQPIYSVATTTGSMYRAPNADGSTGSGGGGGSSSTPTSVVVREFEPEQEGDIRLNVGDRVVVKETYGDGWASGVNMSTREEGVFPQSHVS